MTGTLRNGCLLGDRVIAGRRVVPARGVQRQTVPPRRPVAECKSSAR
ncbi:hypothetical protein [Brachybacterium sacelli]